MKKLPQFGGQDIDLYLLYKVVTNFGGWLKVLFHVFTFPFHFFCFINFDILHTIQVTDERKWHEVAKNFNLPPSCLNSAFALRQLYVR